MSGSPRDLAAVDPWEASLARSRARRERADKRAARSPLRLANLMDARHRLLNDQGSLHLRPATSPRRSRGSSRRCARALAGAPSSSSSYQPPRAHVACRSGTLIAIAAGPAAGLADANGTWPSPGTPTPEPPTTTEHHIQLENGSEGRQVRDPAAGARIAVDGIFGPETEAAVRAFQAAHGLKSMGSWDRGRVQRLPAKRLRSAIASDATTAVDATVVEAVDNSSHASPPAKESPAHSTSTNPRRTPAGSTRGAGRRHLRPGNRACRAPPPSTSPPARRWRRRRSKPGEPWGSTSTSPSIRKASSSRPPSHGVRHKAGVPHSDPRHSSLKQPHRRRASVCRKHCTCRPTAPSARKPRLRSSTCRPSAGSRCDGVVGPETWSALGIDEQHHAASPPRGLARRAAKKLRSSSDSAGGGGILERRGTGDRGRR